MCSAGWIWSFSIWSTTSFQLSIRSYFGGFARIFVHFKNLSLDLILMYVIPCRIKYVVWTFWVVLSKSTEIVRRIFGAVIRAIGKILWSGVFYWHPVICRQNSFSATSTCFCVNLSAGLPYYSTEKHCASTDSEYLPFPPSPGWFCKFPCTHFCCFLYARYLSRVRVVIKFNYFPCYIYFPVGLVYCGGENRSLVSSLS